MVSCCPNSEARSVNGYRIGKEQYLHHIIISIIYRISDKRLIFDISVYAI